jgi:hypothetical protein
MLDCNASEATMERLERPLTSEGAARRFVGEHSVGLLRLAQLLHGPMPEQRRWDVEQR